MDGIQTLSAQHPLIGLPTDRIPALNPKTLPFLCSLPSPAVSKTSLSKTLVIVESPTKAKTIRGFLPRGFQVNASMGHVRDLPNSASEIPASHKGEPWAKLGVNTADQFQRLYVVPMEKKKVVR